MASLQPPPAKWAQRKQLIFLSLSVDDCHIEELKIDREKLRFKGCGGADKIQYGCTIEFYSDVAEYRRIPNDRQIELVIKKKTEGWWPRLAKQKGRIPFIGVDFQKWRDEDELSDSEQPPQQKDGLQIEWTEHGIQEMMDQMDQRPPDLGDFEADDDEDVPELEPAPEQQPPTPAAKQKASAEPELNAIVEDPLEKVDD